MGGSGHSAAGCCWSLGPFKAAGRGKSECPECPEKPGLPLLRPAEPPATPAGLPAPRALRSRLRTRGGSGGAGGTSLPAAWPSCEPQANLGSGRARRRRRWAPSTCSSARSLAPGLGEGGAAAAASAMRSWRRGADAPGSSSLHFNSWPRWPLHTERAGSLTRDGVRAGREKRGLDASCWERWRWSRSLGSLGRPIVSKGASTSEELRGTVRATVCRVVLE